MFGTAAVAVTESPLNEWLKLGVSGGCLLLVWWLIAKTIPYISDKHKEGMGTMGEKLDAVKDEIANGNKQQVSLLQSILTERKS